MKREAAFEIVQRSRVNNRFPHAYIITGSPRGSGLRLAEEISTLLLCHQPQPPCGTCEDCENARHHRHADGLWIEPEMKSRIISVDVMRSVLLPWAATGAYAGGWKICTVLFADRLNDNAANAILKTLEEPAARMLFMLVTDRPEALLPTIRSRCQRLDVTEGRVPPDEPWRSRTGAILAEHATGSALRVFATAGSLVDLFSEINDEATKMSKNRQKQSELEEDEDVVKAWISARAKEMRRAVYESIQDWYRDLLVLSLGETVATGRPLFFEEHRAVLAAKAEGLSTHRATQYLGFVDDMIRQIEDRNIRENIVFPFWFTWLK